MKKTSSLFCLMGLFSLMATTLFAQTPATDKTTAADKILGVYSIFNEDTKQERTRIQIVKATNGKYYGKIVWLKEPNKNGKPKVDDQNPDKTLKNKPILGLQLVKALAYDEKNDEWRNGSIYDPRSGKSYNCFIKLDGEKHIKIHGYIGKSWMGLGRTITWTRRE